LEESIGVMFAEICSGNEFIYGFERELIKEYGKLCSTTYEERKEERAKPRQVLQPA
jgi:hypothetical protein